VKLILKYYAEELQMAVRGPFYGYLCIGGSPDICGMVESKRGEKTDWRGSMNDEDKIL
jgi:hypothetical protein